MTTMINETDFETIEALDYDFEPPCESIAGCDRIATWSVRFSCCGQVCLLCEPDVEKLKIIIKRMTAPKHCRADGSDGCGLPINRLEYTKL
jgi:hypothetical protein